MHHKIAIVSLIIMILVPIDSWMMKLISPLYVYFFLYVMYHLVKFIFGFNSIGVDINKDDPSERDNMRQVGKMRRGIKRGKRLRRK